jgi:tetratricopeptide (TPR) repeat protein
MSLGLLNEAIEVSKASLKLSKQLENWREASSIARSLANLSQPLGQLKESEKFAREGIDYAEYIKNEAEQIINYCRLAHILHLRGDLADAKKYCQKAEYLNKEGLLKQKEGILCLTTVPGYRYCDLLLEEAEDERLLREIISRGECIVQNYTTIKLDPALGNLLIARAYFYLNEFTKAENYFLKAIQAMQETRRMEYMPPFYFGRADFYLARNQLDKTLADLNSSLEIIERCSMKLYKVDYLLMHGRYCLAIGDHDTALTHYKEGKKLIHETGYHLRDAELDLFGAQLYQKYGRFEGKDANFYLQKAKDRIEKIKQLRLIPRWNKVRSICN